MPRRLDVTLSRDKADTLIARARDVDGVIGISVQRDASVVPPGDIVTIQGTTSAQRELLRTLRALQVTDGGSFLTSQPRSLVATPQARALEREKEEMTWEEMGFFLRKEVNPSVNYVALMALCGVIAATGLWLDLVHVVIGAMVIAPGFQPLLRVPFGIVSGPFDHVRIGATSTLLGYAALLAAAALTLPVLVLLDPASSPDLHARAWIRFWSTITPTSVVVAVAAGIAGVVTVAANRPVLTAGVMIALALIPSITITGLALAARDFPLALAGLARWSVDAVAVLATSAVVFYLKQRFVHKQRALG